MSDDIKIFFSNFFKEEKKVICNINFLENFFTFPDSYTIYNFSLQKIKEEIPENVDLFFLKSSESVNEDNKIFFYIRNSSKVNSIIIFPTHRKKGKENWKRYIEKKYVENIAQNDMYSIGRFLEKESSVCNTNSKICVCSLSIGEDYKNKVDIGRKTKKNYCIQHNYDFREDEDILDSKVGLPWNKINLILKCLKENYDYVVWMDADTLIMNPNKTLDDIINSYMNDYVVWMDADTLIMNPNKTLDDIIDINGYDILVSYEFVTEAEHFNSGVMFFRNCDWVKKFLEKVYTYSSDERFNGPFYDQPALNFCYSENILNAHEHIKITYNQKLFNSYWFQYTPGDFILHLARCDSAGKLRDQMELFCPYRKREENEEEYLKRLKKHIELKNNFEKKQ